jgi:rhodanese-related sulfurtransferase
LETSFLVFLQKSPFNMVLFGTAVISGGMLVWPLFGRLAGGSAPQVGAFEAVQLINRRDAIVIDVREKADFAAGHVPNSRHIPFAALAGRLGELEKFKARPLIVNCGPGTAAAKACATLTQAGFKEVFALRGGMGGWTEASLPVEK